MLICEVNNENRTIVIQNNFLKKKYNYSKSRLS